MSIRCPGQDTQFWTPDDIFDVICPGCGSAIEFFKDDPRRECTCGCLVPNPKLDVGCADHCKFAADCMPDLTKEE